jgi:PAS domain S-box-containing protein
VSKVVRSRDGPAGAASAAAAGLLLLAVAATGGAVYVFSVSRIAPHPAVQALLTAIVCLTFVGTGVLALRLPPYARFGLLLAAVGFTSLISVLHEANDAVAYTIGVLATNLVFAVYVHALLVFPRGHLQSRTAAWLVAIAYVDVLVLQAVAVLFDPLTRWHSDHPRNDLLLASHAGLATGLEELEAAVAAAVAVVVALLLIRRLRMNSAAARRQFVPVRLAGSAALLLLSVGLVLVPLSSRAGLLGFGLGLIAALALPAAFLGTLVQGRLSREAVGELLLEFRDPDRPPDLEDALRRTLGDPSLLLGRDRPDERCYVDRFGARIELPQPGDVQVATPILYQGQSIGMLVHDRSLRLRQELLDAASAAAGFALANERALHDAQLAEQRNRALLDAIPDTILRYASDGTYLDARPDADTAQLFAPDEFIGRNVRDVLPEELAGRVLGCIERALATGCMQAIEYELELDGVEHRREARIVPGGGDEVVAITRDFTEQRRAEAEERRLASEQASLRRVATLVAGNAPPERVFQTVTEEVCRLLDLRTAVLHRFEDARMSTIVGKFGDPTGPFEVGRVNELEVGSALQVLQTGTSARSNYDELVGPGAAKLRALGFAGSLGVPITIAGATWGALVVALRRDEVLPLETERRLQAFAELVGLAVASADARDELAASRLRIVEASDAERRRIERNLHDGAQQRLVALSVGLRLVQGKLSASPEEAERLLEGFSDELAQALTELRELAQGIHPAVLTERGLEAALEVLASRAPLAVSLDVFLPERLPEQVETAIYYTISEALANVVKHAGATSATIRVDWFEGRVTFEIADNGVGGADPDRGSGLRGLRDRVETLDGDLWIESAARQGTLVGAEVPVGSRRTAGVLRYA